MSGSVSKGRGEPSEQLQMMKRELMTPDELKAMEKGSFVVMKTGFNPMRTKLPLFTKWGLAFDGQYSMPEKSNRRVEYADKSEVVESILKAYPQRITPESIASTRNGGEALTQNMRKNKQRYEPAIQQ